MSEECLLLKFEPRFDMQKKKASQDKSKTACEATYVHKKKPGKICKSVEQIDIKISNIIV